MSLVKIDVIVNKVVLKKDINDSYSIYNVRICEIYKTGGKENQ